MSVCPSVRPCIQAQVTLTSFIPVIGPYQRSPARGEVYTNNDLEF